MLHRLVLPFEKQGGWGLLVLGFWILLLLGGLVAALVGLVSKRKWVGIAGAVVMAAVVLDVTTLRWQHPSNGLW